MQALLGKRAPKRQGYHEGSHEGEKFGLVHDAKRALKDWTAQSSDGIPKNPNF
jgi:hypothetical protein